MKKSLYKTYSKTIGDDIENGKTEEEINMDIN